MENLLERLAGLEAAQRANRRGIAFWRAVAGALALAGMFLLPLVTARAQQSGGVPDLATRVATLETKVANQANQIQALQTTVGNQSAQIQALQTALNNEAAARQAGDANLQSQVTPLTNLFLAANPVDGQPFFSRQGSDIFVTGANLHIVNGLGATNGNPASPYLFDATVVNGLGNLIVGYNESRAGFAPPSPDDRTGSHNIVVGGAQNFSSFGGLVAGYVNTIAAPYASVSGGTSNMATGGVAAVSGGFGNTASGVASSVGGGEENVASGTSASVSGGGDSVASGFLSSVSGGFRVYATAANGWAAGGIFPVPPGGPGTFHSP